MQLLQAAQMLEMASYSWWSSSTEDSPQVAFGMFLLGISAWTSWWTIESIFCLLVCWRMDNWVSETGKCQADWSAFTCDRVSKTQVLGWFRVLSGNQSCQWDIPYKCAYKSSTTGEFAIAMFDYQRMPLLVGYSLCTTFMGTVHAQRMREQGTAVMPWSTAGWTELDQGEKWSFVRVRNPMKDWHDLDTLHADILRPGQFRLCLPWVPCLLMSLTHHTIADSSGCGDECETSSGKIRRTLKRQALIRTGINHCIGRYGLLARGNQETAAHALVLSGFSRPPKHQTVFLDQRWSRTSIDPTDFCTISGAIWQTHWD